MNLFPSVQQAYTQDNMSARDAQRLAQYIAFGPIVFQASRLLVKFGILENLRNSTDGQTVEEAAKAAGISTYAAKVLLEAGLSVGVVKVDPSNDHYHLSKTGWFLLNDPATRVNMDFNHDVNYLGFFKLEEALKEGRPAGLEVFGDWPTIYEALSSLPDQVKKSWFGFDHFYSDHSFDTALGVVFSFKPGRILDIGGNTGRWAMQCVGHDENVIVTIADLPQQIGMMRAETAGKPGAERIEAWPVDMLKAETTLPEGNDVIWMSQFLDCFSEEQISSILAKVASVMDAHTRVCIMETFWDRQKFEPAAFCLTMTSLYFTAMANGNSKMYHSDDFIRLLDGAGLEIEDVHDGIGQGHSILVCRLKQK